MMQKIVGIAIISLGLKLGVEHFKANDKAFKGLEGTKSKPLQKPVVTFAKFEFEAMVSTLAVVARTLETIAPELETMAFTCALTYFATLDNLEAIGGIIGSSVNAIHEWF